MKPNTKRITAADILAEGYTTRVIVPSRPCPHCKADKPKVVGAQCTYTGAVYGEFQCGHCGTLYTQPMRWR